MDPTTALNIKMYVDANFVGLLGAEDTGDPISLRSRTGFVNCITKCPVLWVSKLQTETVLSTMRVEYITLCTACAQQTACTPPRRYQTEVAGFRPNDRSCPAATTISHNFEVVTD
jgi:hypothetical protein